MNTERTTSHGRSGTPLKHVVIVGAGAAGAAAARSLRAHGYPGAVTVVGRENARPYDRPPLSKQVLNGTWPAEKTALPGDFEVSWRTGVAATALDLSSASLELSDGTALSYDGLVLATGVTPRRLPAGHDLKGVHVLRSLPDCLALRDDLRHASRLVVVGAGFLGAEVAATARGMGLSVTLVDMLDLPMVRQFGRKVARRFLGLHEHNGVRFIGGAGVSAISGYQGRLTSVELTNGQTLPADVVLVVIGSDPSTAWLHGSGLDLTNGIVCDSRCRAAPAVVAAGDVANWYHPVLDRHIRVEHRTNAAEQGAAAACSLLGAEDEFAPVPFAWTDQYDARVQVAGLIAPEAEFRYLVRHAEERFVGQFVAEGRVTAVVGWNAPRDFTRARALIGTVP